MDLHAFPLSHRSIRPGTENVQEIIDRLTLQRNSSSRESVNTGTFTGKCGFGITAEVMNVWQQMNVEQKERVTMLLKPLQRQRDTVIGRFRIHFDTTGFHEPALLDAAGQRIPGTAAAFVDSVGKYFNDVWSREVDSLGYGAPPFETASQYYNVYILDLGSGLYGQTLWDPGSPVNPGQSPPRFASYIEIHNDFQPFYSKGIAALKVTAAHEFHHAVQIGSYGFWQNDIYIYEITSTWLEDVLYNDVNDYYQYLKFSNGAPRGHFARPDLSLVFFCSTCPNYDVPYSRAIWGKFLEKRFDASVIRRIWENMRGEQSIQAMDRALGEVQSNLREAYNEFSLWNFFTGSRADSVAYYTEATHYPVVRLHDTLQFQPPLRVFSLNGLQSLGSSYFVLFVDEQRLQSVYPIVTKTGIATAYDTAAERYQYVIRSEGADESFTPFQVNNLTYWSKISGVSNPNDWSTIYAGQHIIPSTVTVYPNPFYSGSQTWVRFEVPDVDMLEGSIYIFTSSMELIFSQAQTLGSSPLRSRYFTWNGTSKNGDRAATGVYLYVIDGGKQQYRGKFSVIRK